MVVVTEKYALTAEGSLESVLWCETWWVCLFYPGSFQRTCNLFSPTSCSYLINEFHVHLFFPSAVILSFCISGLISCMMQFHYFPGSLRSSSKAISIMLIVSDVLLGNVELIDWLSRSSGLDNYSEIIEWIMIFCLSGIFLS